MSIIRKRPLKEEETPFFLTAEDYIKSVHGSFHNPNRYKRDSLMHPDNFEMVMWRMFHLGMAHGKSASKD